MELTPRAQKLFLVLGILIALVLVTIVAFSLPSPSDQEFQASSELIYQHQQSGQPLQVAPDDAGAGISPKAVWITFSLFLALILVLYLIVTSVKDRRRQREVGTVDHAWAKELRRNREKALEHIHNRR